MLKADMHMHSKEDTRDNCLYPIKDVIDRAAEQHFDVLSITFHDRQFYPDEIVEYAKEKNILLIPGIEKTIKGRHVLLYNFTEEELKKIHSFKDLRLMKENHHLVVAPHPFVPSPTSLQKRLYKNHDVFDAVEIMYLYTRIINFNKETHHFSKEYDLPKVANSDLHFLENFGRQYTLIDSKKNTQAIIQAIKEGKVRIHSKPLSHYTFFKCLYKHLRKHKKSFRKLFREYMKPQRQ